MQPSPEEAVQPAYLRPGEVAQMLAISIRQVWYLVKANRLPPPIKLGPRTPRWLKIDLEAFLRARH